MINLSRLMMILIFTAISAAFIAIPFLSAALWQDDFLKLKGAAKEAKQMALALESLKYGAMVVVPAVLLTWTPVGEFLSGLFLSYRRPSAREEEKLRPALERVMDRYRQEFGGRIPVKLAVMDVPHIYGMALGNKTVIVSTGLLKVAKDEELAGMIAHEVGHLHYRDGSLGFALLLASLPADFIRRFVGGYLWATLVGDDKDRGDLVAFLVILALTFFFVPWLIVACVVSIPFFWVLSLLEKAFEWPMEYRADQFAAKLGFAPAMVTLLESIEEEDIRNQTGFMAKYMYSHPPTALRIERLEKAYRENEAA